MSLGSTMPLAACWLDAVAPAPVADTTAESAVEEWLISSRAGQTGASQRDVTFDISQLV